MLSVILPIAILSQTNSAFVQLPYVQLGHRTSGRSNELAVAWHAPDDQSVYRLEYRQNGNWKSAGTLENRRVALPQVAAFRVMSGDLANLKSGEPVQYRVSKDGTVVFESETIAPKSDRQDYSFAVFGDCGRGTADQAQIAYQTFAKKPDFVVMTGDIVYDSGRISEYAEKYFPYYNAAAPLRSVGAPLLRHVLTVGAPGNHDILDRNFAKSPDLLAYFLYWIQPLNGPLTQDGDPLTPTLSGPAEAQAAFRTGAGAAYPRGANYSFNYGNAHWTVLDANRYVNWSDPKLRAWLAEDLRQNQDKTWRFIALHQPPFHSSPTHQAEKQIRAIADIIEKGKVDVVFGGHVHNFQRTYPITVGTKDVSNVANRELNDWPINTKFDGKKVTRPEGVIYIVDGAGGAPMYDTNLNNNPSKWLPFTQNYIADFGFSHVRISGRKFTLEQVDKDGKTVDAITITK